MCDAAALVLNCVGVALNLRRARTSTARAALQRQAIPATSRPLRVSGTAVMLLKPLPMSWALAYAGVGPPPTEYSPDLTPLVINIHLLSAAHHVVHWEHGGATSLGNLVNP